MILREVLFFHKLLEKAIWVISLLTLVLNLLQELLVVSLVQQIKLSGRYFVEINLGFAVRFQGLL